MFPISKEQFGIEISVLGIDINKKYTCSECYNLDSCPIRRKCSITKSNEYSYATELYIELKNSTPKNISITPGMWELVDSNGLACGGVSLCYKQISPKEVNPSDWSVSGFTKVRFHLLFPELEHGVLPASLIFGNHGSSIRVFFSENEENEIMEEAIRFDSCGQIEKDYKLQSIIREIEELRQNIFIKCYNVLTKKEIVTTENKIINSRHLIESYMEDAESWKIDIVLPLYERAIKEYQDYLDSNKDKINRSEKIEEKIKQLYALSPREFEVWTAGLFEELGFNNVCLTPAIADGGVDITAEKDGQEIAIQCKKFEGIVGAPLMRDFLGAMQLYNIKKGFFVTTGVVGVGAEKVASIGNVEIYDRNNLMDLIDKAMAVN